MSSELISDERPALLIVDEEELNDQQDEYERGRREHMNLLNDIRLQYGLAADYSVPDRHR